jgi:hypothetical protein
MSREGELRRHARSAKSATVQLIWKDRAGEDKFVSGSTVDISESGIRIEVRDPIDKQTYVTLQCVTLGLHGTASVRTCTRKGTKFIVGLEFSGGLRWKPQSKPRHAME